MRMSGHVIGALATTAMRRSVIFRSDGLELVLVFCDRAVQRDRRAQKPPRRAKNSGGPSASWLRCRCRLLDNGSLAGQLRGISGLHVRLF